MAQIITKEIKNLALKLGDTHTYQYLSDLRAAKFGGQGRWSDVTEWLKDQNNSTNISAHDNWEQYERSKSVTDLYSLTQARSVFNDIAVLD